MARLMNVGFGNVVNTDRVVAIVSTASSPAKRMLQSAKEQGFLIDATQGRKTKSLILTDSSYLIGSALLPETLMIRFNTDDSEIGSESDE